jgi:hypothetical protein
MSVDDYEDEYHLTPRGWVEGDSYYYGKPQKNIAPPKDRVLTLVDHTEQSSRFAPSVSNWVEKWRSSDAVMVEELISKFGARPS